MSKTYHLAYRHAEKMLDLVAIKADIDDDKQYESGMYCCQFSEGVQLATPSQLHYIQNRAKVGAVMLPLTKSNE